MQGAEPGTPSGSRAASFSYGTSAAGDPFLTESQAAVRPSNFHRMSLGIAIMLPTLMFLLIGVLYAFVYHLSALPIYMLIVACIGVSAIFMIAGLTRTQGIQAGKPMYWFNVGLLCIFAIVSASIVGATNYSRHMSIYWKYEGQRTYSNIAATSPAMSILDAGKITFDSSSQVVTNKVSQYGDYCVAPIVETTSGSDALVQYWAAGLSCCGDSFTCHDVDKSSAHSGLVFLSDDPALEGFQKAASASSLKSAPDALFVMWVDDASAAQLSYFNWGLGTFISSTLIFWVFAFFAGICIHFCTGRLKAKGV